MQITVPGDHVVAATGELQNAGDVLTAAQRDRLKQARSSNKPVMIVTQAEAMATEKGRANTMKTWRFNAKNVRDYERRKAESEERQREVARKKAERAAKAAKKAEEEKAAKAAAKPAQ